MSNLGNLNNFNNLNNLNNINNNNYIIEQMDYEDSSLLPADNSDGSDNENENENEFLESFESDSIQNEIVNENDDDKTSLHQSVKTTDKNWSSRRQSAGVIPLFVDREKRRVRVLAGRERNIANWIEGSRKWSYFGGRKKLDDADVFVTAAREFVEESLAVLAGKNEITLVTDALRENKFLMRIEVGEPVANSLGNENSPMTQNDATTDKWINVFYFHTCFVVEIPYDKTLPEQFQTVSKLIKILKNTCNTYIEKWNQLIKKVGKRYVPALRWPSKNDIANNQATPDQRIEYCFNGDIVPNGKLIFEPMTNSVIKEQDKQVVFVADPSLTSVVLDILELARIREHVNNTFQECFKDFPSVKNHPAIWYGEDCWFINKDYLEKEEIGWFDLSHFSFANGSDEGTSDSSDGEHESDIFKSKRKHKTVKENRDQVASIYWRDAAYPVMQFLADHRELLFFSSESQILVEGKDEALNMNWRITKSSSNNNISLIEMVRPRIMKSLNTNPLSHHHQLSPLTHHINNHSNPHLLRIPSPSSNLFWNQTNRSNSSIDYHNNHRSKSVPNFQTKQHQRTPNTQRTNQYKSPSTPHSPNQRNWGQQNYYCGDPWVTPSLSPYNTPNQQHYSFQQPAITPPYYLPSHQNQPQVYHHSSSATQSPSSIPLGSISNPSQRRMMWEPRSTRGNNTNYDNSSSKLLTRMRYD
jgi:hypothetical protein